MQVATTRSSTVNELYCTSTWDPIDAVQEVLENILDESMPDVLNTMRDDPHWEISDFEVVNLKLKQAREAIEGKDMSTMLNITQELEYLEALRCSSFVTMFE